MFLIHLHFTHQHALGKHPATSEFYELHLQGCFSWIGISYILPKTQNLSLGNEGFGAKLGMNLWSLNGSKTKHRCYPFSKNSLACLFTESLPVSYLRLSPCLCEGGRICNCGKSLLLLSCYFWPLPSLWASPSCLLRASANLDSSKAS